jgi:hypothetical protein
MAVSTRSFFWLTAIFLGLVLAADPEDPLTAAWDQSAEWQDAEEQSHLSRQLLTQPAPCLSILSAGSNPGDAIAPGGRLLPPKGWGSTAWPALSRQSPRAPPIL